MDTKHLFADSPPQLTSKPTSRYWANDFDPGGLFSFANPDVCTSAGLVANAYGRFRTHFWIDRALIWLTAIVPIAEALLLILIHAFFGVARCTNSRTHTANGQTSGLTNDFIDRACGLQLTTDVLKGESHGSVSSGAFHTVQLQHECYPFVLLIISAVMLIPHFIYHRLIDKTARRDLCLVRSEMHSFRRAVGRELNYLQSVSATSLDGAMPTVTMFSQGMTSPNWPLAPARVGRLVAPHSQYDQTSGHTTAATVGDTSVPSHTPAPTVIPAQPPPQSTTMVTNRGCLLTNPTLETPPNLLTLNGGDADFSAPGLLDLPCFHACHADWSLNTYLSAWQNTDFYWRRYLAKHLVIATFMVLCTIGLCTLIALSSGAPFISLFRCQLDVFNPNSPSVCMLHTTFILNISLISWTFLLLGGLCVQVVFFYCNFFMCLGNMNKRAARYFGLTNRPATFVRGLDETGRCFFADYIRLMAYTAFRDTKCEIRDLSVSYAPELYRTDFHFVSMMCSENSQLIPDAIHIHFWTERYARLCRRHFRRPYWAIRRGSLGHLVRCEDLSVKFNFSKIRVKVEVNDFGF